MKACYGCGRELEERKGGSMRETCPGCGKDVHVCLNCRFYSKGRHNDCTEPKAEDQRTRDRANYCDYFQHKEGASGGPRSGSPVDEKAAALKKLDDLFKKK